MRNMIVTSLCNVLVVAFLFQGVVGQNRKSQPRRTRKPASAEKSSSGASIFDVLAYGVGDLDRAKAMLKKNPNLANAVDESGQTPLHVAAVIGDEDLMKLVLESAKDVNITDLEGATAMHLAARQSQKEMIELLLAKKAKINARDDRGRTPLHYASAIDPCLLPEPPLEGFPDPRLEVLKLLIENKADVNARDDTGMTPLHIAASSGNLEVVQFLIDNKADVKAKDSHGESPLGAVQNYIAVIDLLRRHGGQ